MSKNGFDYKELEKFKEKMLAMKEEAPAIIEELLIGEGNFAVSEARRICKGEKIVDTGQYRMNFHAGNKAMQLGADEKRHDGTPPRKRGNSYEIDFYNNLDYAKHLEYGFRGHFVPAEHLNQAFINRYKRAVNKNRKKQKLKRVNWKKQPFKGIYVGGKNGYVKGRFVLRRATQKTKTTQNARLTRKWESRVRKYLADKGGGSE